MSMSKCECEHEGVCVCVFLNKKNKTATFLLAATFLPGALEQLSHLSLAIKDNSGKVQKLHIPWNRDSVSQSIRALGISVLQRTLLLCLNWK